MPTRFGHGFYQLFGLWSFVVSFSQETGNTNITVFVSFVNQIICNLVLSCIVIEQPNLSIHVENLLHKIWKLVNLVSYVSQQRESLWLYAFEMFHNNDCLLELWRGMVLMNWVCDIVTWLYSCILVPGLSELESDGHYYCCDFGKSFLKTTTRL